MQVAATQVATTSGKETEAIEMALTLYNHPEHHLLSADSRVDETLDVKQAIVDNDSEHALWIELLACLNNAEEIRPEFVALCNRGAEILDLVQIHENFEHAVMIIAEPMESLLQRYGAKTGSGPSIRARLWSWRKRRDAF